ncbi:unnamed protein product, partial [Ixodes pacificus]
FSVDVKDLYYSLPHDLLCEVVSDCIDRFGTIKFQNSCGVSVADFLDLLLFYLRSTSVVYCDQFYIQRKGVCIGSCFAPVLSDLLLAYYDRLLEVSLRDFKVARVFRYVDDSLVLFQTSGADPHRQVENIFEIFKSNLRVFTLTKELTEDNQLRFLDLILVFGAEHVCWRYSPRSQKALLPFSSAHSKLVKRGIALAAMKNATQRSCHHQVESGFNAQVVRLLSAGFPQPLLSSLAEKLLLESRRSTSKPQDTRKRSPWTVIPYIHGLSHNLKKVGAKAGVQVLFSAPNKLGRLCKKVNSTNPSATSIRQCQKSHANPFVECVEGVVYDVPLSCGRSYVGQTGRCINDRLREHRASLGTTTGSNLARHCAACACVPAFDRCEIIKHHRDCRTREIIEAFSIIKKDTSAVSMPSVTLLRKEIAYLEST